MGVLVKTTEDGRSLTASGCALYLDGVKEAEDLVPVIYHPNRENILQSAPDATHMAGRIPLTWEQALAAEAVLKEGRKAVESSARGIAERIRRAQNRAMMARD